jgi:hypothetical protein
MRVSQPQRDGNSMGSAEVTRGTHDHYRAVIKTRRYARGFADTADHIFLAWNSSSGCDSLAHNPFAESGNGVGAVLKTKGK